MSDTSHSLTLPHLLQHKHPADFTLPYFFIMFFTMFFQSQENWWGKWVKENWRARKSDQCVVSCSRREWSCRKLRLHIDLWHTYVCFQFRSRDVVFFLFKWLKELCKNLQKILVYRISINDLGCMEKCGVMSARALPTHKNEWAKPQQLIRSFHSMKSWFKQVLFCCRRC